jgi:hypothetical protein
MAKIYLGATGPYGTSFASTYQPVITTSWFSFVGMVPFSALAVAPEDPALLTNATSAEKRDHQEVRKCKERELEVES